MDKVVWDWKAQFDPQEKQPVFDCLVAEFLLSQGSSVLPQAQVMTRYKASDLVELAIKQQSQLTKYPKLEYLFGQIDMPLIKVLWSMEQTGISLDVSALESIRDQLDTAITETVSLLRETTQLPINWNSSTQVGEYLARLGVPLSRTKTGKYSTKEEELIKYVATYPVIELLLKYRELSKLRSTYIDNLSSKVASNGRIHTSYSQVAAATGRLSSNNPNLQNIPVSSEYGQKIKSCFMASPGKTLVSFDYSQQELRLLAHLTQEEALIEAFHQGQDIHTVTASQLFGIAYDQVAKDQRLVAKTINFGIIYGMGSFGLSNQLNITVASAKQFIDTFFNTYPKIKSYFDAYITQGKKQGYVETLLGRRRSIYEYPNQKFISNNMRRVLMNYPIQGSAADLMRLAMVKIYEQVLEATQTCSLLLQIHDDLVFEVNDDQKTISKLSQDISEIMCNVYPLCVPVEVEVKIGKRWGVWEQVIKS